MFVDCLYDLWLVVCGDVGGWIGCGSMGVWVEEVCFDYYVFVL